MNQRQQAADILEQALAASEGETIPEAPGQEETPAEVPPAQPLETEAAEEETPPAETQDDAGASEEGVEAPSTIAEFAEYLEVEPAYLYGLEVPLGDGTSVPIGELKDRLKGVDKGEQEQLAAQKEQLAIEQQRGQLIQEARAQFDEHQRALDAERANIEQVRQDPQLKALEQSDPGKAALVNQKLEQRAQALHASQQQLDAAVQQQGQQLMQERVATATQQILQNNPGWSDAKVFEQESEPLYQAGERLGYSMAELDFMARTDPRIFEALKLIKRAQDLDKVDLGRVRKAAHTLPSGRQQASATVQQRATKDAWNSAAKVTSLRDKAKILSGLIS